MKERVLVAGLHHESNSFNPIITGAKDFVVSRGSEILTSLRPGASITGIVETLEHAGSEVVPALFARAVPNGIISRDFYYELKHELLRRVEESVADAPIQGITLALHGSMAVQELDDPEGDLLEALRKILPTIPLFVALDMHTTYTEAMHKHASGFVGYKCAPHTDCYETGAHAAQMTLDSMRNGVQATSAWVKIPFLVAGEKSETTTEPMKALIETIRKVEMSPSILAASYLMGFPWADSPHCGVTALIVTDNDQGLAAFEAERLARLFWECREDFTFHTETYQPKKALQVALDAVKQGGNEPVYLSDSGDNPTAGSSADCTGFLELIFEQKGLSEQLADPILYGGIYDPQAVELCRSAIGKQIEISFGAAFDKVTTKPLRASGLVKAFCDSYGPYRASMALFSTGHVDLVFVSEHIGFTEPELFEALGVDARTRQIVVCKLGYLTDPHKKIAGRKIMALTEGSSNEVLERLDYKRVPRPIFPLDREFTPDFSVQT